MVFFFFGGGFFDWLVGLVWFFVCLFVTAFSHPETQSKSLNFKGFVFQRVDYSALPGLKQLEKNINFLSDGVYVSEVVSVYCCWANFQ